MDTDTAEPAATSCYLLADPPRSAGRVLLSHALEEFVGIEWGIGPHDLAAVFEGRPTPDDDAPYVVRCVRMASRAIVDLVLAGRLRTFARPLGGGLPVALDPAVWEIDDPTMRFATSAIALESPFDERVARTHWIFADAADVAEITQWLCGGQPPDLQHAEAIRSGPQSDERSPCGSPADPAGRLLRQAEVTARTGMSRSTLYAKIDREEFPEPVRLGSRFSRWREEDVADWIRRPR